MNQEKLQTKPHDVHPHDTDIWPAEQTVIVPDDSLAPNLNAGDWLTCTSCDTADLGSVVIAETPDGKRWVRRLVQGEDGVVRAATNWGHADWTDFKVIARAVRRWIKGSSI